MTLGISYTTKDFFGQRIDVKNEMASGTKEAASKAFDRLRKELHTSEVAIYVGDYIAMYHDSCFDRQNGIITIRDNTMWNNPQESKMTIRQAKKWLLEQF